MAEDIEDVAFTEEKAPLDIKEPKTSDIPKYFNPLADEVKTRDYNAKESTGETIDIPEPTINISPEFDDPNFGAESEPAEEEHKFEGNEKLNNLSGKEKKTATNSAVSAVLEGYEMLHTIAASKAKIDDQKFGQKVMEGDIDAGLPLQTNTGDEITPAEMVDTYNRQVDDLFAYDPSFNDKVREPLERVFAKRNIGLTDEQFLMLQFGKDIGTKGLMFFQMKKQSNQMMDMMVSMTQQLSNISQQHEPAVKPDTVTSTPKSSEVSEEVSEQESIEVELGEEDNE